MLLAGCAEDEPTLRELTQTAIEYLEKTSGSAGYYLMVEGGRVDHSNHEGSIFRTVTDSMAYQAAVQFALVSDLPCNIRREGGQSLVIGGSSLVILEGTACNPL